MDSVLDSRMKGLPYSTTTVRLSDVGVKKWNVLSEDLPLPVALLRSSALEKNRR
jgi:D-serine dehydratase